MVKKEDTSNYTHKMLQAKIDSLPKKKQEKVLSIICSYYAVRRIKELNPKDLKLALLSFNDFKIIA